MNDKHDVDNGDCANTENVEMTDKENPAGDSEFNVTEKENRLASDDNDCVKAADNYSGPDGSMCE